MYNLTFPLLAALACALCNGIAAVLQKVSADKEKRANSLDARLLWRLFQDLPYVIGIVLDILGWLFTLYAVRYLPLFLVEAVIATNIAITALAERLFRKQAISRQSYIAIGAILTGLVLLALAASPERAKPISDLVKWAIIATPLPIGVIGYALSRGKGYLSAIGVAALSGLAFGGTSVIGRIFDFSHPLWHTIYSPLVAALIASGGLGILLFSIALQRAQATVTNAVMTASQTLIPAIIGIIFLGDSARQGLHYLVVIGTAITLGGLIALATGRQAVPTDASLSRENKGPAL